jgi:hypothetical protein
MMHLKERPMAQHDGNRNSTAQNDGKQQGQPARTERGSSGSQGRDGAQYQQKDMGAHPAYGDQPADKPAVPRKAQDEDYGSRGLHRQAGTTKREGYEERGIGHAEDYDARYDAESSKPRDEAREGRPVVSGQDQKEREAAGQGGQSGRAKEPSQGYSPVKDDTQTGEGDLDISPGAAGGSKHSKRDPASR